MLVRNENSIDIVKDKVPKGISKKMFLYAIISFFILFILSMCLKVDFKAIETYIFIFGVWYFPSYLFILLGIIYVKKENENNKLLVSVSKDYVIFFTKRENKKILMESIEKINKVSSSVGCTIVVFYNENGKKINIHMW